MDTDAAATGSSTFWRRVARWFCGLAAVLGMVAIGVSLAVDLRGEFDWVFGVKYLLMAFACYVFLHVAIRGTSPGWLDI